MSHRKNKPKGVYWSKHNNKWRVIIRKDNKYIQGGYFDNYQDAVNKYQVLIKNK